MSMGWLGYFNIVPRDVDGNCPYSMGINSSIKKKRE